MLEVGISPAVARTGRSRAHFELLAQLFEPGFSAPKPGVPEASVEMLAIRRGFAPLLLVGAKIGPRRTG